MNIADAVRQDFNCLVEAHIELAAEVLTDLVRESSAALSASCSWEVTYANFLAMGYSARPRCESIDIYEALDPKKEGFLQRFELRIIQPPAASCLGIVIGNDTNAARHIGSQGTTQSNAIIGICTDAVMQALGGELLEVDPLNFRKPIPLGEPTLVEITLTKRCRLTLGSIRVIRENGEVILKPAELKMTSAAA